MSIHSLSMTKPKGLVNLGNTCFLNSVLQALYICKPLTDILLHDPTKTPPIRDKSKKGPLVSALQICFLEMKEVKEYYKPVGILNALINTVRACDDDWYHPRQQADAAECIQYLLDGLHDALYRTVRITIVQGPPKTEEHSYKIKALESWSQFFQKEYSPIVEHFYGQNQIRIVCNKCKTVSDRYEPWLMLKAPIPGGEKEGSKVPTFESCIAAAYESETIPDYDCEKCKEKATATIHTQISKLPNILILSLKRFTNSGKKIRGQIDWDLDNLSLKPWMAFDSSPFTNSPTCASYKTFAVIQHLGSYRGGHYDMFVRRSSNEWYSCDDESVREVDPKTVITPDSYVIFAVPN